MAKITGKEGTHFDGPARVFDSEDDMVAALPSSASATAQDEDEEEFSQSGAKKSGKIVPIKKGDVVIIRNVGPRGGPGMPEMLRPTSALMGCGLGADVAVLTDGRFSGYLCFFFVVLYSMH